MEKKFDFYAWLVAGMVEYRLYLGIKNKQVTFFSSPLTIFALLCK